MEGLILFLACLALYLVNVAFMVVGSAFMQPGAAKRFRHHDGGSPMNTGPSSRTFGCRLTSRPLRAWH